MILWLKKRCPLCHSNFVKKNGLYANGKQRWYCRICKHSYHWGNLSSKQSREQSWFKLWVIEGYSARQLVKQSGHSLSKIYRIITHWLTQLPPKADCGSLDNHKYLIFDGTFLHRPTSVVVLMDASSNTVISGKHGVSENSDKQLISFFQPLVKIGLNPISCTTDGNPGAIRVIRRLWPEIIIQRCLVHVQRQGLSWCRMYPKTAYARQLRHLFLMVSNIRNKLDKDRFIEMVIQWEEKYGCLIGPSPPKGRVFSDIKKARSMLLKALPDMFRYLDNPEIARTTNGLEGYFSRLKGRYRQHRGLSKEKLGRYFAWYFHFKPK